MKRYSFLILFLGILVSCHHASSNPPQENKIKDSLPLQDVKNKDTNETKPISYPSVNEEELDIKLSEAFSVVYQSFKNGRSKAYLMAQEGKTLLIVLRQANNCGVIAFYEGPGNLKNISNSEDLGHEIECVNLPAGITFLEPQRVFWYTRDGNIWFSEEDISLERGWSKVGDITLVSTLPEMNHIRGVVDIDKEKVRIVFQKVNIGRN